MSIQPLTPTQKLILVQIKQVLAATGIPPSRTELATRMGYRSANAIQEQLVLMAEKGAITLIPKISRGIGLPRVESCVT